MCSHQRTPELSSVQGWTRPLIGQGPQGRLLIGQQRTPRESSTVRNCHRKKGGRGNCRCWLHQSWSCKFKTSFVKMNSKETSFHLSRLPRYKSSLFLCALCICINIKSLSDDLFLQLFTEKSNKWLFILFIKISLKNNGSPWFTMWAWLGNSTGW